MNNSIFKPTYVCIEAVFLQVHERGKRQKAGKDFYDRKH